MLGGELRLDPLQSGAAATWFNNDEGPLVYREVTGDFTATCVIRCVDPNNPSQDPPGNYRLAGLLARDPTTTSGNRNSVHVAVGAGAGGAPVAAEDKTTTASNSSFLLYPITRAEGELRITRQGSLMSLYYRPLGSVAWQLLRAHDHPEFPARLQVGPMAYSNSNPVRIRAFFDEVRFSRP